MFFSRTTTNVPKQSNGNNNNNNQGNADVATEANGDTPENVEGTVSNAQNYDAKKSRKSSTGKRQQEMENFQQKLLKTLESPGEPEKQEYVDLALSAIALKMKSTLSQHEIMDLVKDIEKDIEMIVNRACREKRRRMQASENLPPPPPPVVPSTSTDNNNIYNGPPPPPVVPSTSTDNNNIFTGPGPQGPMAHVIQYTEEPQYFQF